MCTTARAQLWKLAALGSFLGQLVTHLLWSSGMSPALSLIFAHLRNGARDHVYLD